MCFQRCREKFWQVHPLQEGQQGDYLDASSVDQAPEIHLLGINHASLEAADPPNLKAFYTRVLGFQPVDRPDFPFEGAWLQGGNLLLHIIEEDPTVPKRIHDWKVYFQTKMYGAGSGVLVVLYLPCFLV